MGRGAGGLALLLAAILLLAGCAAQNAAVNDTAEAPAAVQTIAAAPVTAEALRAKPKLRRSAAFAMGVGRMQAALGPNVASAARLARMSEERYTQAMERDADFGYDSNTGRSFYACRALTATRNAGAVERAVAKLATAATAAAAPAAEGRQAPGGVQGTLSSAGSVASPDPAAESLNETCVFKLHSRPGANAVIVLDFTGMNVSKTYWNYGGPDEMVIPAYDIEDVYNASFTQEELANIYDIWRGVASDYAAFDVDVTTEEFDASGAPLEANGRGTRAVIGGSCEALFDFGCGGIAYVGGWGQPMEQPVFVFPDDLGRGFPKYVWDATSHEVGHSLGLSHDGAANGVEYYEGHANWAPIMGNSYYRPITTFSKGEYRGANNKEDDLSIITTTIPYRTDDYGNTAATAITLQATQTAADPRRAAAAAEGNIERTGDVDFFAFEAAKGVLFLNLSLTPDDVYAKTRSNLDAKVQVWKKGDTAPLATFDPKGKLLSGGLTANLPADSVYYLSVAGTGDGADGASGYTSYASLGEYRLSLEFPRATGCPPGFTTDSPIYGDNCTNVNECAPGGVAQCHATRGNCTDTEGSYTCSCLPGYIGDGYSCADINECAPGFKVCSPNAVCNNTVGSYSCTCKAGYTGNGTVCTDIDECATNNGGCGPNSLCGNFPGGFNCTCKSGFKGNGRNCTDINECLVNNGGCSPNANCNNLIGGFNCTCKAGYAGNGTVCADIDECATTDPALRHNCSADAVCSNTAGAFTCTCKKGYRGNGNSCTDINECTTTGANNCNANAWCTNLPGNFSCACKAGYSGNGVACADVNECTTTDPALRHKCSSDARCVNTPGNFTCICKSGFRGDGYNCTDINECLVNNGGCSVYANCTNLPGNRNCSCRSGFSGNGVTCTDINECSTNNGGCSVNALCANFPGGFNCTCKQGYAGNGTVCTDINECLTNNGNCSVNANCTNTPGSRICLCKTGFTGNGVNCTDINECATNNGGCGTNAVCANLPGTRSCGCKPGFGVSTGTTCLACSGSSYSPGGSLAPCLSCSAPNGVDPKRTSCGAPSTLAKAKLGRRRI